MLWEYMTAGNETPAFQSDRGTSGPHRKNGSVLFQGSELEGSHVDQESVKSEATTHGLTRDIIKKDTSMLESVGKLSENPGQGLNQNQFRHSAGLSRLMGINSPTNRRLIIEPDTVLQAKVLNIIVGSTTLLQVNRNHSHFTIWRYYSSAKDFIILKYVTDRHVLEVNVYFDSRVKFNTKTGSLTLMNLKMAHSGLYEVVFLHRSLRDTIVNKDYFLIQVQEKLRVPRIVQTPIYTASHVQLMCIVDKGIASSIVWLKDDTLLKSPQFQVEGESSTVYIKDMEIKHCGMYTCIVKNEVSTNSNSYFLTAEEVLFILICVALISIVALVSGLTTFIATVVIIITLTETQDPDRQNEVTTIFMVFQLVSIISLLIACVLSVFESGLSLWCRTTAGFGCFLSLAVIIYISILYLGLNTDEFQPFLSRKIHRCIILICEILCVAISVSLIQQSIKTVQEVDIRMKLKAVRHATQQRLLQI
ncbi:uncharacterized protein [Scyliorhinus torazame]|uniref:uncharacterized protein isoform X2 n=1 Tax=Scyliorhinus torazame TaxID=75743 RepID=UPI003B5BBC0F